MAKWVRWLEDLDLEEITIFGKKCVNLGKMIRDGLAIPPGFAISTEGYEYFANEAGFPQQISDYLRTTPDATEVENIEETSRVIQEMISNREMSKELQNEVSKFYEELCEKTGKKDVEVAVRSSGAVSMPGQFESYLFVCGVDQVIRKVVDCWASSFTARAMRSRIERGMNLEESPIGVAVLKMVNARCSGIMFTINPITEDRSKIVVEGNWGLGETVASGTATPDWYKVNRITMEVEEKKLGHKNMEVVYDTEEGGTKEADVPPERREIFCLDDVEIRQLAILGNKVEKFFGGEPQDIEWAIDKDLPPENNILLVQSRPEKTWALKKEKKISKKEGSALDRIVGLVTEGMKVK
jgi:pyruvate,water dikinase